MKKYVLLNTPTAVVGALVFCASSATADSSYPTLDNTATWRFDRGGVWDTSGSMTYDAGSSSYGLNRTFTYAPGGPSGGEEYYASVDHTTTTGQENSFMDFNGDFLTFTSNLSVEYQIDTGESPVGYVVDFTGRFSDTPAQDYLLGFYTAGDYYETGDASVQLLLEVGVDGAGWGADGSWLSPVLNLHEAGSFGESFAGHISDWHGKEWKLSMQFVNSMFPDADEAHSKFTAYLGATDGTPIPGPGIAMACAVGLAGIKRRRRR